MSLPAADTTFLSRAPTFASFARIADVGAYLPIPDDWVIGCADVVASTRAIREGRYKTVNMAGAAVIASVSNAVGLRSFPYVFGGDGASFAVPAEWEDAAREALAATAVFVREEFGLELRVGLIPVAEIRAAGLDVRLAQFAASPHVSYAMFSGGGLAWAETQLKAGRYAIPPAAEGARPDLSGLSCRFDSIPARRGVILALIVRPSASGSPDGYRAVIQDVLALVEGGREAGRPLPAGGPSFAWPPAGLRQEAKAMGDAGSRPLARLRLYAFTAMSYVILRFGLRVGGFDPKLYMADLVANSDYRKYDDGLRMTIDCSPDRADRIEARLAEAARAGAAEYGLHRQGAALMTCITPSPLQRDHVHFVDGAEGGYAAAAANLKAGPA